MPTVNIFNQEVKKKRRALAFLLAALAVCLFIVVRPAGAFGISVNYEGIRSAILDQPVMGALDNIFGGGEAFVDDPTMTSRPFFNSSNGTSIITEFLESAPASTVSKALMGVAMAIVVVAIYIRIIKEMERGDPSWDFWLRIFIIVGISVLLIIFLDDLFKGLDRLGHGIINIVRDASKSSAREISQSEQVNQIIATIKATNPSTGEKIFLNIQIFLMWLIAKIPAIIAYIATFGILFELVLRRAFAPIALAFSVLEGARGASKKYFQKFLAIYIRIAMFYVIAIICMKFTVMTWDWTMEAFEAKAQAAERTMDSYGGFYTDDRMDAICERIAALKKAVLEQHKDAGELEALKIWQNLGAYYTAGVDSGPNAGSNDSIARIFGAIKELGQDYPDAYAEMTDNVPSPSSGKKAQIVHEIERVAIDDADGGSLYSNFAHDPANYTTIGLAENLLSAAAEGATYNSYEGITRSEAASIVQSAADVGAAAQKELMWVLMKGTLIMAAANIAAGILMLRSRALSESITGAS